MERNIQLGDGSVPDRWEDKPQPKTYITEAALVSIGIGKKAAEVFTPYFNKYANIFSITQKQFNAFLAQVLHESGGIKYVKEIWSNTSWQKAYEGHVGLGNTQPGDGKWFLGRGLIMITGRKNYTACSKALFGDDRLIKTPQLLEVPEYAVASAYWYCFDYAKLADEFETEGIEDETRLINGKQMLGLEDRKKWLRKINDIVK